MIPTPQKRCKGQCQRILPVDGEHFHRHAFSADGFMARCRQCRHSNWGAEVRRRRIAERVAAELADTTPQDRRRRARIGAELTAAPDPKRGARAARIVELADESLRELLRRRASGEDTSHTPTTTERG